MQAAKTAVLAGDTPARMNGMASAVMHGVQAVASVELVSSAQGATAEAKLCGADTGQVAASTGGGDSASGGGISGAAVGTVQELRVVNAETPMLMTTAPACEAKHAPSVALSEGDTPAKMNGRASAPRHGPQFVASVAAERPSHALAAPLKSRVSVTGHCADTAAAAASVSNQASFI
jgi:hypothetical protein